MYKHSLVVFLDILGLTDSIRETEHDQSKARPIADMLAEVRDITEDINRSAKSSWKTKYTAHAFSDSILISCPRISRNAFIFMAHVVAAIQFGIMRHQFFLRGGMSAGGHYERGGVAFGPAFVRAYEMEKLSIWPRVLIDPIVLRKLPAETVRVALASYVSQDENGLCYFNYLHLLIVQQSLLLEKKHLTEDEISHLDFAEPLRNHKRYLLTAVEKLKANARLDLLPKYHALANYHNRYVKEVYQDLPTQESYREVDLTTVSGQIINDIKTLASSREGIEDEDIDSLLDSYIKVLYQLRWQIQECEIDLGVVFRPLYPHLG